MDSESPEQDTLDLGYEPLWVYDGPEGRFGFTVDDGCYLALTTDEIGRWKPYPFIRPLLLKTMMEHLETMGTQFRGFSAEGSTVG